MDEISTDRLEPTAHVTEISDQPPRREPGSGSKRHPPPPDEPEDDELPGEAEPHQVDSLA
jgi:hypothetical protein